MNPSALNANIVWTGGPFTTTAEDSVSNSRALSAGTGRLAQAVIWLAIHDLGAWCRKCRHHPCPCGKRREDALTFLQGLEAFGGVSTLEYWATLAGWPHERISSFFSETNKGRWIQFVINVRAPYRRARRGASAPVEATFTDLLVAHSKGNLVWLPTPGETPLFELTSSDH